MIRKYEYRVFPETWKARALLAIAFVGGFAVYAFVLLVQFGVISTEETVQNACSPVGYPGCLQAQDELTAQADDSCTGSGNHLCLVPLGRVSSDLVRRLVDYYDEQYGLRVGVLKPTAIPGAMLNEERDQVDAIDLAELIEDRFPRDAHNQYTILIGLTPVDMYISTSNWRYAFGYRETRPVISTARMDPAFYGLPADDALTFSRVTKLMSKYVGRLYYHLSLSDDPRSPMFSNILGPADLDGMGDRLPVQSY